MKKTLLSLLLLITGVATFFTGTVEAIDGKDEKPALPYDIMSGTDTTIPNEDISAMMARENLGNESLLNKFLNTFGFGNAMYTSGEQKAIIYIRAIINLLLSLVTFIALVILLYSFYLMFFTEESKGIETVKKNMKGVVIALVILGLSRVIVSFIFSLFNRVKCPAGEQWSETKQKCEQQK